DRVRRPRVGRAASRALQGPRPDHGRRGPAALADRQGRQGPTACPRQVGTAVSVAHSADARVVVYSRDGCHLCEAAEQVVATLVAETGDDWVRVDIDTDPELKAAFTDQVPVTFVDGRQHDFWRVDPARLRAALARRSS